MRLVSNTGFYRVSMDILNLLTDTEQRTKVQKPVRLPIALRQAGVEDEQRIDF